MPEKNAAETCVYICNFMKRIAFGFWIIVAAFLPSLASAQERVWPVQGWLRFQDSLYNANDTLKTLLPKGKPALAYYNFTVKKGRIQEIELSAQMNIKKATSDILKRALKAQNWKHLGKKTNGKVFQFVFWYGRINHDDTTVRKDTTSASISAQDDETETTNVNREAQFPGGQSGFTNHIIQHFEYPKRCRDKEIEGYVQLRFIVNLDGSITRIRAMEESAACPEFTKEAIRVIKLSEPWIPAVQNGEYVRAVRSLPIKMALSK